jgi:Flp pilus assembly protein TadD
MEDPPPVEVAMAIDRFVAGNVEGALEVLRVLCRLDPPHPDVFYVAAMCERSRHHFDQAAEDLSRALELRPRRAAYLLELGLLQLQTGRREAGLETLRQAVGAEGGDDDMRAELYIENAAVLFDQGCDDLALLSLQKALKFSHDRRAYRLMARILMRQKRWAEAVHWMSEALSHYPQDARLLATQGVAYAQGGRVREARPLLEAALAIDTENDPYLRFNLAQCCHSQGDIERAAELSREALSCGLPAPLEAEARRMAASPQGSL